MNFSLLFIFKGFKRCFAVLNAEFLSVRVHFATARPILNARTPVNQLVDFCKYPKNAKNSISRKHPRGEKKESPFAFHPFRPNL
jgi:hypothetical protein